MSSTPSPAFLTPNSYPVPHPFSHHQSARNTATPSPQPLEQAHAHTPVQAHVPARPFPLMHPFLYHHQETTTTTSVARDLNELLTRSPRDILGQSPSSSTASVAGSRTGTPMASHGHAVSTCNRRTIVLCRASVCLIVIFRYAVYFMCRRVAFYVIRPRIRSSRIRSRILRSLFLLVPSSPLSLSLATPVATVL